MYRSAFLLFLTIFLGNVVNGQKLRTDTAPRPDELASYLKTHWTTPEKYVVSKFRQHDIVFVGELHRVKHDLELIHNLIPQLYKAGVYNLGMEFGCTEFQDKVDKLITDDKYDEELARWLIFQFGSDWGYKEYQDIYRKAWELNRSLPPGRPKFRIVHLWYQPNWAARKTEMTRELWGQVWHKGDPDEYMANVVLREFIDKKLKALIYSGSHHAFTSYRQPIYDFEAKKFVRFVDNRMGNVVFAKLPGKVFNIFLHAPFYPKEGYEKFIYPVNGVIDDVMKLFSDKRVGFDVKDSPFGRLADERTLYAFGYTDFRLSSFCDGYIFQKPLNEYEGVTVDPMFITEGNFQEAVSKIPNPVARNRYSKPEELLESMSWDVDWKRRFRNLK